MARKRFDEKDTPHKGISTQPPARESKLMVRYVNSSQNQAAGRPLSAIYSYQRVVYGDKFFVVVY
jgi:hypothetical protein